MPAPSNPAAYCPYALAKNHIPIIIPLNRFGDNLVIIESPIGDKQSSPKVIIK